MAATDPAPDHLPPFPQVAGRSLLGDDVELPAGLPAERTLVLLAFQQWQQGRVDRWIARAVEAGIPPTPRGRDLPMPLALVEVPALSSQWRPVRRFIDGGMSRGIGDPDVLARTITVYTDVGALRSALTIPDGDDVWAMVVTRDGEVHARTHGEPDDDAWAAVAAALPLA